jgi:hypothetical protein
MRRALLPVGLIGLILALAGFGGSAGALSQAQVCGSGSFSAGGARCIADERAGVLSSALHCSARVRGLSGQAYTGTFSYRGRAFPAESGVVSGDGWVYTSLALKGGTFPAGPWTCRIDAGSSHASVSFRTAGAVGTLTSTAACPTAVTIATSDVRACRDDRSPRPFSPTSKITCSGVYSLANGRIASAQLLYKGKPTGLSLKRRLPLPVSVFGMQVSHRGGLPAGAYTCVFLLDGKRLATTPFSIAARASSTP